MAGLFSINNTVSAQSNAVSRLKDGIHKVTFDGVTRELLKDGKYDTLQFKFSNKEGSYTHTIFELTNADTERKSFNKDKDGNPIYNPSNIENFQLFVRHLIKAVYPKLDALINEGKKSLDAGSWADLQKILITYLDKVKGTEINIKLNLNKDGYGEFPRFFSSINRDSDTAYISQNFLAGLTDPKQPEMTKKDIDRNETIKAGVSKGATNVAKIKDEMDLGDLGGDSMDDLDLSDL